METNSFVSARGIPAICRSAPKDAPKSPLRGMPDFSVGEHLIGEFVGKPSGPTLIVIGGIHGNEPGGAIALSQMADELAELQPTLNGRAYFLAGNTRALGEQVRFVDADLNRFWTPHNLSNVGSAEILEIVEGRELTELDQALDAILITAMDEVFVLDLHSTSADGMPFATVGDTLRNRDFAMKFPVTILLGIEEQLDGTMLEYLNNAGAVTLGFEGGQHTSEQTVENHKAMVRIALTAAGILDKEHLPNFENTRKHLGAGKVGPEIFEVRHRHAISAGEGFQMKPGFSNFDPVNRGDVLGRDKNGEVMAIESGMLLMPLYQKLGDDGFFLGRKVSPFWLWLSGVLRGLGIQNIIHMLPGVSRDSKDPATLIINTRIAWLFPLQVFHLLGFRRRRWEKNKLVVSRRKHDTSGPFKWKGI